MEDDAVLPPVDHAVERDYPEEKDNDETLSIESFTIEDGIIPKMEAMDDMPDQTEESHPTQTDARILKPLEVFVNVDMAVASGEMTEEERDPLEGEDMDVKPSALIIRLDQGVAGEEDGASSPLSTGKAVAFGGVKQETSNDATETSARARAESSAKRRSSSVTVMYRADVVGAAVDVGGERVGGLEEKNSEGLIGTGHQSSVTLQQGTRVPEAAISHWMQRGASLNSQNDGEDTKEGIGSVPHNTSGEKFVERSDSITQRNAGVRIEHEDDSKTPNGNISNGPLTTDDESDNNFSCNECGKVFRTKDLLRGHVKVHYGTEVLECDDCHLEFSERSEHERHQSVQNGISISKRRRERAVTVDVSGEAEGTGKTRKKYPATCQVCKKQLSHSGHLKTHMKCVHIKERKFPCDICGKAFGLKHHLETHLRYHSGLKPYPCSQCQKSFTQLGDLRKHILSVHEIEKAHTCGECGKTFSHKQGLKKHMIVHTGEMPYTCTLCSKAFRHSGNLKRHVAIHARKVPHPCNLCSKTFAFRSELQRHLAEHRGEEGD